MPPILKGKMRKICNAKDVTLAAVFSCCCSPLSHEFSNINLFWCNGWLDCWAHCLPGKTTTLAIGLRSCLALKSRQRSCSQVSKYSPRIQFSNSDHPDVPLQTDHSAGLNQFKESWTELPLPSADCIGSAFNAKGAMECPNCRRVEDGNWLMLGGSQSADDALYEVPYDFDDEEYLGMPVDALDTEMREVGAV
jgi:hypothetical protein